MRSIDSLIVHHSASPLTTTTAQIARYHASRFRFGIGYARVIEAGGEVLDGRKIQRVGAHAKGSNTTSIGVCVVGDNTVGGQHWTVAQNRSLEATIRYYLTLYPYLRIGGHRDTPGAATECPGLDVATWCENRGISIRTLAGRWK